MNSVYITNADESDIKALVEMTLSLQNYMEKQNSDIWPFSSEAKNHLKNEFSFLILNSSARVLKAVSSKGQIIGMAVGKIRIHQHHLPKKSGVIENLYIREKFRRRGIGKRIVYEIFKYFSEKDIDEISITYPYGNKIATEFWKKMGFHPRLITSGKKLIQC